MAHGRPIISNWRFAVLRSSGAGGGSRKLRATAPPRHERSFSQPLAEADRILDVTRALILTAVLSPVFAQTPQGTSEIRGRVLASANNAPLGPALVSLTSVPGPAQRMMAGYDGTFVFRGLPAARVTITVTKPGYLDASQPIDIGPGASISDLLVRMQRQAVIAGRLVDDRGMPLVGVEVHALRRAQIAGESRWLDGPITSSNDRGEYRLAGLAPGDYTILARPDPDPEMPLLLTLLLTTPAFAADVMAGTMGAGSEVPRVDARVRRYPVTLFPSATTLARATIVAVRGDTEKTRTDLKFKSATFVKVTGAVSGVTDTTAPMTVRLLPGTSERDVINVDAARTLCDETGRFEFARVAPGRYVIVADSDAAPAPGDPPDRGLSGRSTLVVPARDLNGVNISARARAFVDGRIVFDGATPRPAPAQIAQLDVRLEPVDPVGPVPFWRARIANDSLRIGGLPAGRYLLRIGPVPRWTPQSAMLGGKDLLSAPIQIAGSDLSDLVITFTDGIKRD